MTPTLDTPQRVLFAGTPQTAVPSLEALIASGHDVVAVLTRPDAPVGRKRVLTPSPVAQKAEELAIPVIKAARLTGEAGIPVLQEIAALDLDIAAVVAYGGLIPASGLELPRRGWVNLHFSLLPAYRGAAPVQHAVISGERRTGASVFQLEEGLDTGPVFSTLERELSSDETAGEVLSDLAVHGAELLSQTLRQILAGAIEATPQVGEPTYAPKLTQDDGRIDPSQSAAAVAARINGVTPEPGAWAETDEPTPQRIKLIGASPDHGSVDVSAEGRPSGSLVATKRTLHLVCADGTVRLDQVQPAGKKPMRAVDWFRGQDPNRRFTTGAARDTGAQS